MKNLASPSFELLSDYELLDSGNEKRIERFGKKILIRPYKRAIWNLQESLKSWQSKANAEFDPDTTSWHTINFHSASFEGDNPEDESWHMNTGFGTLALRLQKANQIGVFPEHLTYLSGLNEKLSTSPKVLNLFAYSGAASIYCLKHGAQEVTHIDISHNCLSWTKENIDLNNLADKTCRLIPEDALEYIKRLERREELFDLIIADPPAFSRSSKSKEWVIHEILPRLANQLLNLLSPKGVLVLTSHAMEVDHNALANVISDQAQHLKVDISSSELLLQESKRGMVLACGHLAVAKLV
jgi:23S rRNA (cytosine1962-C5)-methyltransferase